MKFKNFVLTGLLTASVFLSACSSESILEPSSNPTTIPTVVPTAAPPIASSISVVPDPSLEEINLADPYAQISEMILETYKPNKELYNTLFDAIDKMETNVDVSGFPLSPFEKSATCDSLYSQVGFQFYYVNRIRLSGDGNTVTITYRDQGDEVKKNKALFYSKLNHLVYNVAPENYSPLQKLFAVYDYITVNADYTDNMQDETTFTPYSILMKGRGICGGFANLGHYVLNRVGIQTDYISNEPHAWNIVELDGKKYHTDMTWGAGNYGSGLNSLRTILMDDEERNTGLDLSGFGGYSIIEGYPRLNPTEPSPAPYKDFSMFYTLY
ncbi:MAG: hypothetical protein GX815_14555, partial [Clostridiales bacterium]|nr:hypothetical protein [Clostridiales bacterium]